MQDFIEKSKSLLTSTKENWKDREAFLKKITNYVRDTEDPDMIKYLMKCYKHIAIQMQDLRYLLIRSMIVKYVGDFIVSISETYGERLNLFSENFLKCEETIKTLGSANKGSLNFQL